MSPHCLTQLEWIILKNDLFILHFHSPDVCFNCRLLDPNFDVNFESPKKSFEKDFLTVFVVYCMLLTSKMHMLLPLRNLLNNNDFMRKPKIPWNSGKVRQSTFLCEGRNIMPIFFLISFFTPWACFSCYFTKQTLYRTNKSETILILEYFIKLLNVFLTLWFLSENPPYVNGTILIGSMALCRI